MEPRNPLQDIKVVGFDLDQTLYPKSPVIDELIQSYLYEKIAEHRGVTLEEGARLFKERYRGGAGMTGSETLTDLGLADASTLVQEALEHADLTSILVPDPEMTGFLERVRDTYEGLDLITGSSRMQTQKKLAALGLSMDTFSHVITKDESSKSTGDSYQQWFALYPHLSPHQFLYVGDRSRTDHDIPSALGIRTCLVYVTSPDTACSALQLPNLRDLFTLLPII